MNLFFSILQRAYGCHHREQSRVFTINHRTYQVCLQCGHEREYSLELMQSVRPNVAAGPHAPRNSIRHADSAAARTVQS